MVGPIGTLTVSAYRRLTPVGLDERSSEESRRSQLVAVGAPGDGASVNCTASDRYVPFTLRNVAGSTVKEHGIAEGLGAPGHWTIKPGRGLAVIFTVGPVMDDPEVVTKGLTTTSETNRRFVLFPHTGSVMVCGRGKVNCFGVTSSDGRTFVAGTRGAATSTHLPRHQQTKVWPGVFMPAHWVSVRHCQSQDSWTWSQNEPNGQMSSNSQERRMTCKLSSNASFRGQDGSVFGPGPSPAPPAALPARHWPYPEQKWPGAHQLSSTQSATQLPPVWELQNVPQGHGLVALHTGGASMTFLIVWGSLVQTPPSGPVPFRFPLEPPDGKRV